MATRSMFRDLDTGDSSIASTTILKLFEEKSTEDVWSNVSSAGDVLSGLLPKVTALRARAVSDVHMFVFAPHRLKT